MKNLRPGLISLITELTLSRESRIAEELKGRIDSERMLKEREADVRRRFELERKRVMEAFRINENIALILKETEPRLVSLEQDIFGEVS